MYRLIFIIPIVAFAFSCKTSNNEQQLNFAKSNLDTLFVSGKNVVFLTITTNEFDALPKYVHTSVSYHIGYFSDMIDRVDDTLESSGFKLHFAANRFIKIKLNDGTTKIFDRLSDNTDVIGVIITDGIHQPQIKFGIMQDSDLFAFLRICTQD